MQFFSLPNAQLHSLSLRSHRRIRGTPGIHGSVPKQPPLLYWACHLWYGIFPLVILG